MKLILCLLLAGCATYDGYDWTRSSRGPLPVVWYAAGSAEAVHSYCRAEVDYACALYGRDRCTIIAQMDEAHTPRWLAEHERRHCAGWDHA